MPTVAKDREPRRAAVLLSFAERRGLAPEYRQLLDQAEYLNAHNEHVFGFVATLMSDLATERGWTPRLKRVAR